METIKNILIYLGAHNGRDGLLTKIKEDRHDLYYAFECNTFLFKKLEQLKPYYPKLRLMLKAAWIHNENMTLNIGIAKQHGSSFFKKNHLKAGSAMQVECIDFSKWLQENFKDESIDLFFDIEGAEYEILHKMIEDGSIDIVKSIEVEWHTRKIETDTNYWDLKKHIVNKIKEKKIALKEWKT